MPFIPVPNGVQAEIRYLQQDQRIENTFWFLTPGANPTPTDLQSITDFLWNWWQDEIQPIQSNFVLLREIYVTDQSDAAGETNTYSPASTTTGANANEPMPNSTTIAISLRTAKRGRSYRGRSYVVGLTRNQVVNSNLTSAAGTAWVAAYDALISGAAAGGYQLCVCSRFAGGDPRPAGVLTPVTDALITDFTIDSQRRRLPGRGE